MEVHAGVERFFEGELISHVIASQIFACYDDDNFPVRHCRTL